MVKKCFLSELGNLEATNCIWFSFFQHVYFIWLCSLTLLGITVCPHFFNSSFSFLESLLHTKTICCIMHEFTCSHELLGDLLYECIAYHDQCLQKYSLLLKVSFQDIQLGPKQQSNHGCWFDDEAIANELDLAYGRNMCDGLVYLSWLL